MLTIIVLVITDAEIFFKQPVLPCVYQGEKLSFKPALAQPEETNAIMLLEVKLLC